MSNMEHSTKETITKNTRQTMKDNRKNNPKNHWNNCLKKKSLSKAQRKRKLIIQSVAGIAGVVAVIAGVIIFAEYYNNEQRFRTSLKEGLDQVTGQILNGENVQAIHLQLDKLDFSCMISDEKQIQTILDDMNQLKVAKMKVRNEEESGTMNGEGTQIFIHTNTEEITIATRYELGKIKNGLYVCADTKEERYEPQGDLEEIIEKYMLEQEKYICELTLEEVEKLAQKEKITWSDFELYDGRLSNDEYLSKMDKQWWIRAYNDTIEGIYRPNEIPDHIEIYSRRGGSIDIRDKGFENFIKEKIGDDET